MTQRISRDDVAHVAGLARLDLDDGQIDHFTQHLASVLDHASEIENLDLDGVEPMTNPRSLTNVMREDIVGATLDRDAVLAQAPVAEGGRFRVPPILGEAP
jgi:aspartyl-tRNA(Asn)/glutamyl-tRNA(Gln) amidotransferase subunit C